MRKTDKTTQTRTIRFEVMDTTLRDGEQTQGVSMIAQEKITIARLLLESVKVDRIEVASARVSKGEHETVRLICDWASKHKLLDRVEILGFVDHKLSADWAAQAGCKVINLLTKGSRRHCEVQLRKTCDQHLEDIGRTIHYGHGKGITYNIYLEDWSGGMLHSPDYVRQMIDGLRKLPVKRIMIPDTLGLLWPQQVREFVGQLVSEYPDQWFDFHAHNDYGLAVANCLEALAMGARGVHTTVNSLGERAGNVALDEVVVTARDFTPFRCNVDEKKLSEVSFITQVFTGKRVAANKPIIGEDVFTQTAGIHADGDKKGNLYESRLTPQRFGRARTYALGKLMGKASLDFNLKKIGIELSEEQKGLVLTRIVELADAKKVATSEDLPFIISDVLQTPEARAFEVVDFSIISNRGLRPCASVLVRFNGMEYQATASGDGGYDAFMRAIMSLEKQLGLKMPRLIDYAVRIPPGGKTDALVETTITWEGGWKTRGVNSDQLVAAINATSHAINIVVTQGKAQKLEKTAPRKAHVQSGT